MENPAPPAEIALQSFYAYGYRGRLLHAVRAPFGMDGAARELIGRMVRIDGRRCEVVAVARQISGPIAAGEPIGVETRPVEHPQAAA